MKVEFFRWASSPEVKGNRHSHTSLFEFHYVIKGRGFFQNGDRRFRVVNGSLFFSPPEMVHDLMLRRDKTGNFFYLFAIIPEKTEERLIAELTRKYHEAGYLRVGVNYRYAFEDMRRKIFSSDLHLQAAGELALKAFLHELLADSWAPQGRSSRSVEEALRIMQERMYGTLSVAELAQELALSKSYFIRIFKRSLGVPPQQYFIGLKMETACFLLRTTDMPVYSIASQLHFSDEFYFSNMFKKHIGSSPRAYRKREV